jgi:hypothetical protein
MNKNDKLVIGSIAGIVACLIKDVLTIIPEFIFRIHPSFWDYGHYLIYQKPMGHTFGVFDLVYSILMELVFGTALGVLFAHTKHLIKTEHPLLRGCLFGPIIWFLTRSAITVAGVKALIPTSNLITTMNWGISFAYGISLAWVIEKLEKK